MEGRLIFRHRRGRLRPPVRRREQVPPVRRGGRKAEGAYDPEVLRTTAEKSRRRTTTLTVLKPTQVGGMSILRRSRERSRRNSANWPRNFGRRGAPRREPRGPQ